jgi:transketolase
MSEELCINSIRVLSADVVQKANSGHPGAPMGMAPIAHLLWSRVMNYSPKNPKWWNRDRFVLSNGHGCALQYVMLHLTGYEEFSLDELKRFRQINSKTPGHPESHLTHGGIEVTTGPLGQGFTNAIGLAICQAHLAATYNKPGFELFNNYTYVTVGDGCMMEGITSEGASLAGHLGLNRLIVFYDDNHISIDGETELAFTEDVSRRFESYGWHSIVVPDGDHNVTGLAAAVREAHSVKDKPVFIRVRTTIGFGSSKQGTEKVHGAPLGADDVAAVKKKFGFDPAQSFVVPQEVINEYRKAIPRGEELVSKWNHLFAQYKAQYPELAAELERRFAGKLPDNWKSVLPTSKPEDAAKATRQHSQVVINAIAKIMPELVGGSADLNPSTLSYMECSKDFQKHSPEGRNIRFGVREHAMAAICNGIEAYGGFRAYGATFLNFIGYAMGAVVLSALSHLGVIYVMTHDSIGLGEDGPTHQPINTYMMIRAMPNILFIRPADGNETSGAYAVALENSRRPSVLALCRQAIPNLKGTSIEGVYRGAYTISEAEGGKPQLILVGTGSELHVAVQAAAEMKDIRVRVVSMPSWELFGQQPIEYRQSVFPDGVPILAVEAASVMGWREYAHSVVGMENFGASGPVKDVLSYFGFNAANVVKKSHELLDFYSKSPIPPYSVVNRPGPLIH